MNFSLRAWEFSDIDSLTSYANNAKIAANLRNAFPFPYSKSDAESYLSGCIRKGSERQLSLAIVVDGEAAGSIGIFLKDDVYEKSGELGYWLAEPFWGRGIVTAAVKEICAMAFHRYDLVRIFAEPYARNIASCRVLEKAGFELEGVLRKSVFKNGQILDSCLYALVKKEDEKNA